MCADFQPQVGTFKAIRRVSSDAGVNGTPKLIHCYDGNYHKDHVNSLE